MNDNGLVSSRGIILEFLNKSYSFGSLFILANELDEKRIVCEIKNINEGLDQISFVPLGEDELLFSEDERVHFVNEANNVSFVTKAMKNHNKSWLTLELPTEIRVVNLRQNPRISLSNEVKDTPGRIVSFGEEGDRPLMENLGDCLDISETGASFEIKASRIDGYYKGDQVELSISKRFSFLSKVRGRVVHKSLAHMMDKENRTYRIGIKFDKELNLKPIQ
ncbi:MAG: PilZ domain-containing protein [Bacteriovoracaceae bacterium]|nr:PilZ domain-containing protein [Bacteriovoracaceae bacterium]